MKKRLLMGSSMVWIVAGAQAQVTDTAAATKAAEAEAAISATVIVTGTRRALAAGVDLKKGSVQFIDAVVADDIGKLPDINVAESLARVSGVQLTQGIGGEGSSVTIRGSRDNVTLFNGRQVIDVGGRGGQGLDTLGTSSYGILSIIPSELVGRLEVTKLPGADEIEGALGGTVNIVTRKPLDLRKRLIAGSIEGAYRSFGSDLGKRTSLLYADVNASRTFGVLANFVYAKSHVREDNFSSFSGWQRLTTSFNTNNPSGAKADNNGDGILGSRIADLRYQNLEEDRERSGATFAMQWKPRADFDLFADVSYMNTEAQRERAWLGIPISGTGADWLAVKMSKDDYIVGGTELTRLTTSYENMNLKTDLITGAVGGTWRGDGLKVFGELAYSRSKGKMLQYAGVLTTLNRQTVTFDMTGAGADIPSISIANLNLSDPAQYVWTNNQENRRPSLASDKAAKVDFTYNFDRWAISTLQAGARISDTYYDFNPSNNSISSTAGVTTPGFNTPPALTPNLVGLFSQSDLLPGANLPRTFLVPSSGLLAQGCRTFDQYYNAAQKALCAPEVVTPLSASTVSERTKALYFKVNFDTELFGFPLEANIGTRYVETDLVSEGFTRYVKGGASTFTRNRENYSRRDMLPSVVAKWSLPQGVVVRAGAAQVIARPATSLLNSSFTLTESVNSAGQPVFSGSGGSPGLKPYEVNQFDVATEWYFGKKDLMSLGLFYKDVNTYFVRQTRPEVILGVNGDQPFNVSRTVNGTGATVRGAEFIFQKGFDFLPAPFNGFGTQVTLSHIESETPTIDPTTKKNLPLPGLSKNNANLVLYYETAKFGARIAYTTRNEYFDSIGANEAGIFYDAYRSMAFSAYLNLPHNMKLTLSASNLLSEPVRIYAGSPEYIKQFSIAKPIYTLNLSAKF